MSGSTKPVRFARWRRSSRTKACPTPSPSGNRLVRKNVTKRAFFRVNPGTGLGSSPRTPRFVAEILAGFRAFGLTNRKGSFDSIGEMTVAGFGRILAPLALSIATIVPAHANNGLEAQFDNV